MSDTWRTYRVSGYYDTPINNTVVVHVLYQHDYEAKVWRRAFDTTVYCANPLEVHQHTRRKIAEVEGVPYASVTVERVEVVRYD